ncbi:hypothetical protein [Rubrobacter aplysinae]|uniref:hypothetical protein n=1 Tax=Rubrobacter aplysinae TaxID=909625 RepID=UPI00064B89E6|nr:hypothetical protein [Rubrobacter aplysinae]
MAELVLLANAGATLFMAGVIWFVQIVHYPLMGSVGRTHFVSYAESHSRLTSYVVGPPMLVEAATAALLLVIRPAEISFLAALAGAALVAAIWLSTAFLQVPRHEAFGRGYDRREHGALVATNWIRTLAWTLRGLLVLGMVWLTIR